MVKCAFWRIAIATVQGRGGVPGGVCQNGGTTGGTQVACNLGGIRGFAVVRGDGKNQHREQNYACALLSDTFFSHGLIDRRNPL
jgi:hypothetical protein